MEGSGRLLNWKQSGIKSWNRLNAMLECGVVLQAAGSHGRFLSKCMARTVLVVLLFCFVCHKKDLDALVETELDKRKPRGSSHLLGVKLVSPGKGM